MGVAGGGCFPVELGLKTWHFSYLPLRATDKLEYRRIRTTFENMNLPNVQLRHELPTHYKLSSSFRRQLPN